MSLPLDSLIWLFPIAFMFHDFEEILFFEPWLKQNAPEIKRRLNRIGWLPSIFTRQLDAILSKSTAQFAFPVLLIFSMTVLASYLAAVHGQYSLFFLASGAFFLHGFMHLGQAILLRRYVPAVITSALVAIPYGLLLYPRLLAAGLLDRSGLLTWALLSVAFILPFILIMHPLGERLYQFTRKHLLG